MAPNLKSSHERFEAALDSAYEAAAQAQIGMVEDMGALDCGFAWAVSHDRAFNTYCRKMLKDLTERNAPYDAKHRYGSKHYEAGWCFWRPGPFNGQSVGIHRAGAIAFADNLAHSLQCRVESGSRLD